MKKILNILGIITLIGISIIELTSCSQQQSSKEELKKIKKQNKFYK